jgi:hypothetical protein
MHSRQKEARGNGNGNGNGNGKGKRKRDAHHKEQPCASMTGRRFVQECFFTFINTNKRKERKRQERGVHHQEQLVH